jgi:hypothetical protein
MNPRRRRIWRIIGIVALVALVLVVVAVGAFAAWGLNALPAMPEALAALESDGRVNVTQGEWIVFAPVTQTATTGFVFYPGARVDPKAYAPPLRELAEQGYLGVIVPMPLNFAILATGRADDVITAHPEIEQWYIGGHSLGGASAAIFADQNPEAVDGVAFWAAFPPNGNSLADQPELAVSSIYGTLDGLATVDDIAASIPLMPADAVLVPIEGGNHAQFGWYGAQQGDNPATISREEQQRQVVDATLALLAGAE